MKTRLFLYLLPALVAAPCGEPVKRNFIGVGMGYHAREKYEPRENLSLVFYDNFNDNTMNACWKVHGNIQFMETDRSLKAQMKTLKQSFSSGAVICEKSVYCSETPVRVTVDQTLPNRNASIFSSIFFVPAGAGFDASGHPTEYIRFFKRSQVEFVETKKGDRRPMLLWGRNMETTPGKPVTVAMQIDRKNVILLINDEKVFSGRHNFNGLTEVRAGLWIGTKGVSFAGGNMVYDNFLLETGTGKIVEPDTVLKEAEPEAPVAPMTDSPAAVESLPPPPSAPTEPPAPVDTGGVPPIPSPPESDSIKTEQ